MVKISNLVKVLAGVIVAVLTAYGAYLKVRTQREVLSKTEVDTRVAEIQEEEYGCRHKHIPLDREVEILNSKISELKTRNNEKKSKVFACQYALSECRIYSKSCEESLELVRQGQCNDLLAGEQQQQGEGYNYQPAESINDDLPGYECTKTLKMKSEYINELTNYYLEIQNAEVHYKYNDCLEKRQMCIEELRTCYERYDDSCPNRYPGFDKMEAFLYENDEILSYY